MVTPLRGTLILIVFFSLFTVASLLMSSPMPPGTILSGLFGMSAGTFAQVSSALFNGLFYGVILWTAFVLLSKRLGEEK